MPQKKSNMPRSRSSLMIRKAIHDLKKMPKAERIQLMVNAKLMSQEEADRAIQQLTSSGTD